MILPSDRVLPLLSTTTPLDQAGVAEVVEQAFHENTPVYPMGGGTSLSYGAAATRAGVGLSLAGLRGVIDYPARDLTITVEAGITIEELAQQLASQRQRLPVDVPQARLATLGGVVATDPSGARRFYWGTMRDYVIGIRAVDGRGVPFAGGGRVVKNAAGYDLCRLLTGSMGTLGVITQITLMVKPVPETSAFVACDLQDFPAAERLLAELNRTATRPTAVELLTGPIWMGEPILGSVKTTATARLVVGFEGTEEEIRWMVEQLRDEWRRAGVAESQAIEGPTCDRLWKLLTEFPAAGSAEDGEAPLVVEVAVAPSEVVTIAEQVHTIDPDGSIQVHAGSGVLRAKMSELACEGIEAKLAKLRSAIAATGGSLVVLLRPAECNLSAETIWGPSAASAGVVRAIKDRFDPKGILNPGRFVF